MADQPYSTSIMEKLNAQNIILNKDIKPAATYVPYAQSGNLLFISGQLPFHPDGSLYTGKIGDNLTIENGQDAAKLCAIQIISCVYQHLDGDFDRIKRFVKLGGFVNSTTDFDKHHLVLNGASDFIKDIFGERGMHTRFAMGAGSLPLDVAVEIEAIIEIAE